MTEREIFENNLSHFKIKTRRNNTAQCFCPAHDDKEASLTITMGDKCTLFKCHAGCDLDNILGIVDLEKKDTFYDIEPQKEKWITYIESRERKKLETYYNYISPFNGNYLYTKIRLQGKDIKFGTLENNRFTYGLKGKKLKDMKGIYGNLQSIKKAIAEKKPIFLPEGEKDVDTLTKKGYVACTYGSASDWNPELAPFFKGAIIYILADNDEAGIKTATTIYNDLKEIAKNGKIILPVPNIPHADITDYFNAGHTKEEFKQLLQQEQNTVKEKNTESLQLPAQSQQGQVGIVKPINKQKKQNRKQQINNIVSLLIKYNAAKNYSTTDKGSGALFADIFKDKHRYNPEWKDFAYYDGKKWLKDIEGMEARRSAKMLVDALFQYTSQANLDEKEQGNYYKFVYRLTQLKNRNAMINDSKDKYYFCNNDLDKDNFLLNCQNGILNLRNNEIKFIEHDADLLLSKICNVKYDPTATCKNWEKFLNEVMLQDKEKIKYLQKIAGISLTGDTKEETMFILYGATTRNGKSTFVETIIYLLGDYATTIQPETLATKNNKDSRQANGDVAKLKGIRFVNASEPKKRMILDTALLKALTGGDTITARNLYEREFEFSPIFKLMINTNYLPQIADDTIFSSGRINIISFDRHFEPQEQDKDLKNRLKNEQELSGILNWCIAGLKLYQEEGLEPPETVKSATSDYRQQSDKIGNFINECLEKTGKNSKAKDIYEVYIKWCEDNGYGCENKGNFFAELKNKNIFATTGTINGKTYRNIVKGYEIAFTESEENVPFD